MRQNIKDYLGREIKLTEERMVHILEHREMKGLESMIEQALTNPEFVIQSLSDPQDMLYYQLLLPGRLGVKWLCVVVKHRAHDAFVLTAYLTNKLKKGVQVWPSK